MFRFSTSSLVGLFTYHAVSLLLLLLLLLLLSTAVSGCIPNFNLMISRSRALFYALSYFSQSDSIHSEQRLRKWQKVPTWIKQAKAKPWPSNVWRKPFKWSVMCWILLWKQMGFDEKREQYFWTSTSHHFASNSIKNGKILPNSRANPGGCGE